MNTLEKEMLSTLTCLKKKHHITAAKFSFEDEGTSLEMAQIFTTIVRKAGVEIAVKIGGCEAKKDLYEAKLLGADRIIAPMIETPYAAQKFAGAIKSVYADDEMEDTGFMINVETFTGYQNLEKMLESDAMQYIDGVVLGRVDFAASLGKTRDFVDSDEMLDMTINMAELIAKYNKKMVVGGGISVASLNFLGRLPKDLMCEFENRNVIFDFKSSLEDANIRKALIKLAEFELQWLLRKKDFYSKIANADTKRIAMIEERYKKLTEETI